MGFAALKYCLCKFSN